LSGTIWSKFFWSDYENDPALKLCSLAAQGLWMRMLCIASAHDPIGYVAVAGRALDETDLARLTGSSESEVASLLGELDRNVVFSRDRHGRIFSRRMTRDARKAATARKNGKLGGNPTLSNKTVNTASDNPPDNVGVKPQKPEAKSQSSSLRSEDTFDAFWRAYPKRDGDNPKAPAEQSYQRALRIASPDEILRGAKLYAAKHPNRSPYVAQAVTWLNQKRWRDELEAAGPSGGERPAGWPSTLPDPDRVRTVWAAGNWPSPWGPRPDEPGCMVPREILDSWQVHTPARNVA
jgi:hypothetical protein